MKSAVFVLLLTLAFAVQAQEECYWLEPDPGMRMTMSCQGPACPHGTPVQLGLEPQLTGTQPPVSLGGAACLVAQAFGMAGLFLLPQAGVAALNTWESLRGRDYRAYAHPPEEMLAVLAATGLRPVLGERAGLWWVRGLERAACECYGALKDMYRRTYT